MHDAVIVLKFGGSVLRDRAALADVVGEIRRFACGSMRVVAVVSALRGRTDELFAECRAQSGLLSPHAVAARVASGERECAALLLGELERSGIASQLLDPVEIELVAHGDPLDADPVGVSMSRLQAATSRHEVVVVPGFVAVDASGEPVLFGRGGSDLTALFLARALSARCRLVKDVDGLHAADPSAVRSAVRVRSASFEELARTGGRLVQEKAIAFAKAHGVSFEIAALGSDEPTVVAAGSRVLRVAEGRVVVVGSRGMVGATLLEALAERGVRDAVACSQPAEYSPSAGDVAFLAVSAEASRAIVAQALACGARIVDCSSAFREDSAVPLVVPEVNAHELRRDPAPRLVASPNCSATMLVTGLEPLRAAFGLSHVFVATYQAVSGAGRAAVEELESETRRVLDGQSPAPRVFPQSCAFNVFPHESPIDVETSCNEEEQKLVAESRRMWGMPGLAIDASCARVPVRRAHCQAVTVTLARPTTLAEIRAALARAAGVELLPDNGAHVASAQVATGRDAVFVSRVRWAQSELDKPEPQRRRVSLWIACDQLRKGAATNAVQIAQHLGWLPG